MKNSNIEWIGQIPKDWDIRRLRYLGSVSGGMSNKKPEDFEFGTPFINYKNVYKNMILPKQVDEVVNATEADKEKYSVKYGDTLFTGSSETIEELGLSSTCLNEIKYATFNGFTMRFRPTSFKKYNPEFMKYYYRSEAVRTHLVAFDNSVTRTNLSQEKLKNIIVLLPPINEQAHIADFLDKKVSEIDNVIARTKESIEEYKKLKQSIITEAVTKGLDPETKMKDSNIFWIGQIPKKWTTLKIKYASWLKGRIGWDGLKSTEYIEEGPYLITGTDFKDGSVDWTSCVHITKERFDEDELLHIKENDLLITKDGTVGKLAIVRDCPEEVSLNSGVLLIRNNRRFKYDVKYLYYVLMSNQFRLWYELSNVGNSTIKHLYQEQFYNFEFSYPDLNEQNKITVYLDDKCSKFDELISKKEQVITELEQYKKSLIYEYVTGKKEVA